MSTVSLLSLADDAYLANRPLPRSPDGRYDWQEENEYAAENQQSIFHKVVTAVATRIKRGPLIKDPKTLDAFIDSLKNKTAIDDRKGLFTDGLYILSQLPTDLPLASQLNGDTIALLYNTLEHPPATYVGTNFSNASGLGISAYPGYSSQSVVPSNSTGASAPAKTSPPSRMPFTVRTADGSGNNPLMPMLGQAGTPYARSVQSTHPLPANMMPDPGLVFDALLKARDWKPHPGGNSSLTFAYASLVTHQLFRTDPSDMTKNNTSSYLDLSILYGINQAQQDAVRNKQAGRGLLWPDAFAEDRLVLLPPASSVLLVMFSRNHNYIAEMLLKINERGLWSDPPPDDQQKRATQDEEIFQVARLVNCGHFMASIMGDYVAGFLALARSGNGWSMDPFDPITTKEGIDVGRGEGNHCSVEFNLLYRWHATTAQTDITWTEELFKKTFNGKAPETLTIQDFIVGVTQEWRGVDPNPRTRTFANLTRGADGKFDDDQLADMLLNATENMAGAYRARGTPAALRIVEILAMQQARSWGVCSMNEFRKFLGLKQFSSFEEWSSNPVVADAARQLYGHIDNLELYPGLQAEDIMPLGPAYGLCCGYTMTRAILADAICLVRGDRFNTIDYTPGNLTAWGFADCARDTHNGAFGAAIPKLLFRHFPRHFPYNSGYALFSFFTPETTKQNLVNLGIASDYDINRPSPLPVPKVIDTVQGIEYVIANPQAFKVARRGNIHPNDQTTTLVRNTLFPDESAVAACAEWYAKNATDLVQRHTRSIDGVPGARVDVVNNVINLLAVHWASEFVIGLPLKTESNPRGLYTEQETFDMFKLLYSATFTDVPTEQGWTVKQQATRAASIISKFIGDNLAEVSPPNMLVGLYYAVLKMFSLAEQKPYHAFLSKVAQSALPASELVAEVMIVAVGLSVACAQVATQVVDFYLDESRKDQLRDIVKLLHSDGAPVTEVLRGYVREAQRLNPLSMDLLRLTEFSQSIPLGVNQIPIAVKPGDAIALDFKAAQRSATNLPNPGLVDPRRPQGSHAIQGLSSDLCPDTEHVERAVTEIVKVVFRLKNLRRAPGNAGRLGRISVDNWYGISSDMYVDECGKVSPWPGSLTVEYDS